MPTKNPTKKEEDAPKKAEPKTPKGKYYYASGKRKTSIARVKLFKGKGEITVNDKPVAVHFPVKALPGLIKAPLVLTGHNKEFDVYAYVKGGGVHSQAEAVRHGISKALIESDPLLKPTLKKAGYLTRDSRIKERKKYGLKRARKGPQFSKR